MKKQKILGLFFSLSLHLFSNATNPPTFLCLKTDHLIRKGSLDKSEQYESRSCEEESILFSLRENLLGFETKEEYFLHDLIKNYENIKNKIQQIETTEALQDIDYLVLEHSPFVFFYPPEHEDREKLSKNIIIQVKKTKTKPEIQKLLQELPDGSTKELSYYEKEIINLSEAKKQMLEKTDAIYKKIKKNIEIIEVPDLSVNSDLKDISLNLLHAQFHFHPNDTQIILARLKTQKDAIPDEIIKLDKEQLFIVSYQKKSKIIRTILTKENIKAANTTLKNLFTNITSTKKNIRFFSDSEKGRYGYSKALLNQTFNNKNPEEYVGLVLKPSKGCKENWDEETKQKYDGFLTEFFENNIIITNKNNQSATEIPSIHIYDEKNIQEFKSIKSKKIKKDTELNKKNLNTPLIDPTQKKAPIHYKYETKLPLPQTSLDEQKIEQSNQLPKKNIQKPSWCWQKWLGISFVSCGILYLTYRLALHPKKQNVPTKINRKAFALNNFQPHTQKRNPLN